MIRLLVLVAAMSALLPAVPAMAQGAISNGNYTTGYANSTVTAAYAYVSAVNVSGYLVFQPNLTRSLTYLDMAQGNVTSHPSLAVYYADRARTLAQQQYGKLVQYRYWSMITMMFVTAAMAAVLGLIMRPVARKAGRGRGAVRHGG